MRRQTGVSVGGPVGRPVGRTQVAGDRCRASRRPERSSLAALDGWHRQSAAAGSWVHLRLLGKGRHENGRGCGIWTAITLLGRAIRLSRGRFFSSSLCCARRALDGTLCWVWPSAWTLSSLHLCPPQPILHGLKGARQPCYWAPACAQLCAWWPPGGLRPRAAGRRARVLLSGLQRRCWGCLDSAQTVAASHAAAGGSYHSCPLPMSRSAYTSPCAFCRHQILVMGRASLQVGVAWLTDQD